MNQFSNSKILPDISSKRNSGDGVHPLIIEEEFNTTNKFDNYNKDLVTTNRKEFSGLNDSTDHLLVSGQTLPYV
jgi:hypothetical protein